MTSDEPTDPEPERPDHPLDEVRDRRLVERHRHPLQPPAPLDPHPVGAVDHHLGDRRVGQQRLERAEAADPRRHPGHDGRHVGVLQHDHRRLERFFRAGEDEGLDVAVDDRGDGLHLLQPLDA